MKNYRRYEQMRCFKCKKMFWGKYDDCCGSCRIEKFHKTCLFCGKDFDGIKIAVYCSKDCQQKNFKSKLLVTVGQINRFKILARDNFKCIYCGRSSIEDGVKLHVDHINPLNRGGKSTVDNLITSCSECNTAKQDSPLSTDIIDRIRVIKGI